MDLIAFRVSMYKGILDSGWVDVNPLTVLVGKNESGKTSLLKALHKLNPYNSESHAIEPESYNMEAEWPRALRKDRKEAQEVCRAKFRLSDEEKSELAQIAEGETCPDTVEVSRDYAGNLKINFEGEIFSDKRHPDDIDNAFDILPEVQDEFGDPFKQRFEKCIKEARLLAHEGRFSELMEVVLKHSRLLREALSPSEPPQSIEHNFIVTYVRDLEELIYAFEPSSSIESKIHEYVINHLPTFIYMDDYRTFSGTAPLNDIQYRRDQEHLTEKDKTFLTILSLSALDLDELVQLGQGDVETRRQRQLDLADGGATLTRAISDRLSQRNYKVEYQVDGQDFFTIVKDDYDPSPIELKERSKGFQWFFSFDLMLMHESKGTFEGCVILLDEPGLHLHPESQKDLLRRLEEYASGNTLLYTTHLPFMIDLNHPDRIRVLKETDNGIVVTTNLTERHPEAKFVLQAALGMDASQSFLVANRNLVVEGVDDYWVLTELSNLLRHAGEEGIPEDVRITPCGGASQAVNMATFMIGQELSVVGLFDSDSEGQKAYKKLTKEWITRYANSHSKVILLGDAVDVKGDFALEDLFPENFILDIVEEAYSEELAIAGVDEITLQGKDTLWRKIKRFMKDNDIEIKKDKIAPRWRKKLSAMNDASELPDETREKAIKLFQAIRSAFGEG